MTGNEELLAVTVILRFCKKRRICEMSGKTDISGQAPQYDNKRLKAQNDITGSLCQHTLLARSSQ